MNGKTAYKGRLLPDQSGLFSITCTIISGISSLIKLVLGISIPVLATFQCSCQKLVPTSCNTAERSHGIMMEIMVKNTEPEIGIDDISVFSFDDDSLGRLDSYQKISGVRNGTITIASRGGRKRIFVCGNMRMTDSEAAIINTADDFEKLYCALEETRRSYPLMLGMTEAETGVHNIPAVTLKPMTSEIVLNSIRCDFTGMPYEGENITDCKVYLINVNAQCNLADSSFNVRRMINMGMLNMDEVRRFREPDIIFREIEGKISEERRETDIRLLCFHNFCQEESPGSPFTRLVIEGRIQGETYYWPVTINRTGSGEGVLNNTRHVIDLTIRRKGSLNPDEELTIEDCGIMMEFKAWKEMEEYTARF